MKPVILIKRRAIREIHSAAKWWSENRPAAPGAIEDELDSAFRLLVDHPEVGVIVVGANDPKTRKLFLGRIRYLLFYRPRGRYLEIIAFWHSSRGREPRI